MKRYLLKMIKNYTQYLESISGTELIGQVGPNYGDVTLKNKTINKGDTSVIYSEIDNKIYTQDDYQDIYRKYLIKGGKPLHGFNKNNLEKVIAYINS